MILPMPGGGNFTPTPEGQHVGVLTRLIDLGKQTTEGMYGVKTQPKVLFGWEIPEHRVTWEKDGAEHEGPVMHFERMTLSMHENAIMRQRLESWRGRPFTEEEFGKFDMKNLLGIGALFQISHKHDGGRIYANMTAIMLPPGGKDTWPKPEGEVIHFSLADFNNDTFDKLSENLQNTIKNSPEYQQMFDSEKSAPNTENPAEFDDEIPF